MTKDASYLVPTPGSFIREELEAREWSQRDLAFVLGCSEQAVNPILAGKRGISPDMAKALGDAFGVAPEFFLNLQKAYDLQRAKTPDPDVSKRARLQDHYPVREMIKRGWFEETSADLLEEQICRFFKVPDYQRIPRIPHAAKKTHYDETPASQLVWLFRVKQLAEALPTKPFSAKSLRASLTKLKLLMSDPEEARHVPKILSECGIRFIVVEPLPSSKIDGVAFWIDSSPVIGMSLRFDRIDNFWFVLRHEIEHILQGHGKKKECLDVDLVSPSEKATADEEIVANSAAEVFGLSNEDLSEFLARYYPLLSENEICSFAKLQEVHPGIVVGRVQRHLNKYNFMRHHLVKVREHVCSSAVTDGWGKFVHLDL
jgi:HTH-type transcriptional regulator / antitoxin HigA